MRVAAGKLRQFVTFESTLSEQDSDGATVETWVPELQGAYFAAEIAPLSGKELIAAAAVENKVAVRIVLRYVPGIIATWRVRHRDAIYNIEAVTEDPETGTDHLTLMCSRGVNNG